MLQIILAEDKRRHILHFVPFTVEFTLENGRTIPSHADLDLSQVNPSTGEEMKPKAQPVSHLVRTELTFQLHFQTEAVLYRNETHMND